MIDVREKVNELIVEALGIAPSEITSEAHLIRDLGMDSLEYADLVMQFEMAFDIKIPDLDAEELQTVSQVVAYIENKVSQTEAA